MQYEKDTAKQLLALIFVGFIAIIYGSLSKITGKYPSNLIETGMGACVIGIILLLYTGFLILINQSLRQCKQATFYVLVIALYSGWYVHTRKGLWLIQE